MESSIYNYSYNDICNFPAKERKILLELFDSYTRNLPKGIYRPNRKLGLMLELAESEKDSLISEYCFDGEKVLFYPNIKRIISKNCYTCAVSGMRCGAGEETILYKPFFFLPDKKESYVLNNPIRAQYYYEDFFPTTIKEYDDFLFKVEHSYELDLEEYYNFSSNIGGALSLRKLNRH